MTLKTDKIFPRNGKAGDGGGIIQVVQTVMTDQFTTASVVSSGGYVDITGLAVTITPQSASNKIFCRAVIYNSNNNAVNFFRMIRGSTFINQPSGTSSRAFKTTCCCIYALGVIGGSKLGSSILPPVLSLM